MTGQQFAQTKSEPDDLREVAGLAFESEYAGWAEPAVGLALGRRLDGARRAC